MKLLDLEAVGFSLRYTFPSPVAFLLPRVAALMSVLLHFASIPSLTSSSHLEQGYDVSCCHGDGDDDNGGGGARGLDVSKYSDGGGGCCQKHSRASAVHLPTHGNGNDGDRGAGDGVRGGYPSADLDVEAPKSRWYLRNRRHFQYHQR